MAKEYLIVNLDVKNVMVLKIVKNCEKKIHFIFLNLIKKHLFFYNIS